MIAILVFAILGYAMMCIAGYFDMGRGIMALVKSDHAKARIFAILGVVFYAAALVRFIAWVW